MQLIAELEKEKRGVYAGAVGYFGYSSTKGGVQTEGAMDTCIALRTMVIKDGAAYLQAGGGIVFDSDPYEEFVETISKLGASMQCIASAEEKHLQDPQPVPASAGRQDGKDQGSLDAMVSNGEHQPPPGQAPHIDLAAG